MAKLAGQARSPLWRVFVKTGGWWAIGAAVIMVLMTGFSASSLSLAKRFDAEGREASAQIEDRYFRVERDSDGDETINYFFKLTFVSDADQLITVTRGVSGSIYDATQIGDQKQIWYLPSQPETIELSRGENRRSARTTQVISLIAGIIMLGVLWRSGGRAVAGIRARKFGEKLEARVVEIRDSSISVNRKRYRYLCWRTEDGTAGESLAYPRRALKDYPVGARITVYKGLKRTWWEGDVGRRDG